MITIFSYMHCCFVVIFHFIHIYLLGYKVGFFFTNKPTSRLNFQCIDAPPILFVLFKNPIFLSLIPKDVLEKRYICL